VIRQHFCETYRDKWPRTVPKVPQDWSLEAQKLEGHETDVRAVAFSDDNQMIATGSADGTIKLWDAKSGEEKHNLIGHKDCVRAVVFLPSGTLVSGSYDKTLRFWDTGTGKELKKIQAHDDYILTLALSPLSPSSDSQLLASGSMDTTIKIWDSETGAERQRLMGHGQSQWVQAVAFSPLLSITQMLASASSDKTVRLWDIETGVELRKMEGHKDVVNAVAFSFNGELLASASDDKTIRLWSTQTGNAIRELEGHSDRILAVALSPSPHGTDGSQVLVSASVDKSIKLWNTSTGKETGKLEGHDLRINDIAFSASGTMLASVSDDATCRLWDMNLCGRPRKMEGHSDSVMGLEGVIRVIFSSDGQVVLSVSTEGNVIRTWSFQTGVETNHFEDHTGGATCFRDVTFSPDGQTLATISFDETVRIWDVGTGNEKHKLEYRFDSWPGAIAFSPNGKMLAAIVSMENDILIWDTKTGNLSQAQKYSCSVADGLLFSPDSRLLTAVPGNGEPIELLDLENGKTRKLKGSQGSCTALAFSPNSRYLASASTSIGTIRLWDTKTGREKHSFQDKETEEGSDLHWSDSEPESEGLDGTLVPEGVDSELEIEGVDGASDLEDDEIRALAFSPDGKLLVLASNGRPVRLWDVESREFVQDHLGNNDYAVTLSSSGAIASLSDSTGYSLTEHISCSDYNGSLEAHATTILQIEDQWLRYLGKDVLWLPQEFRGLCWSTSGHKIAIGQRSGSVSFFQFR
jgi:WD40 repeat protein